MPLLHVIERAFPLNVGGLIPCIYLQRASVRPKPHPISQPTSIVTAIMPYRHITISHLAVNPIREKHHFRSLYRANGMPPVPPYTCTYLLHTPSPNLIINLDLHNRSRVRPMRPNHVVNRAQNDNAENDQHAPIHRRQRHRRRLRPETEEQDDEHEYARKPVRDDSKHTGHPPRTPAEILARRSGGIGDVAPRSRGEFRSLGRANVARDAAPEQQCADDEVGRVKPIDGQRKQIGERGRRADGDQPQKDRHDRGHENCVQGNELVRVDAAHEPMPRDPLVTCKRPQHARRRR